MKSKIIYEDDAILVCLKEAGIAVQSANITQPDMESELKNYLAKKQGKNPYLGVIQRLDQPVRGVLVFAKTREAAAALTAQLTSGEMTKIYTAKVYGSVEPGEGILENELWKDAKTNTSFIASEADLKGIRKNLCKHAKLCYRVISTKEEESFLEIQLYTGRHHQIRVQMAGIGHAILGDTKYGTQLSIEKAKQEGITNLCLCAQKLQFYHPITKKKMEFTAE